MIRFAENYSEMEESLVSKLQAYFAGQPVLKAWLFGSRSRGDYHENSDFDFLVRFDNNVGLFKYSAIVSDLEKIVKKNVDLVTETAMLPWVKDSVNKEKILIYEREA